MEPVLLPGWVVIGFAGLFGSMVGSFFNVVIYRMPRGESVVWPASHCTHCGYRIKTYQNIPILSWLLLRGKCRSCRSPISMQYPIIEALTGVASALVMAYLIRGGAEFPWDFKVGLAYLALTSIPIFIIDFRHYLIPDVLTLPGIVLGLLISFLPGGLSPWQSLLGGAGAGFFLWLVGYAASLLLKKDAMGLGDVKLIAMAGCLFGLQVSLFGLIFASVLGCVAGLPMLLLKKLDEQHHIPFGPYICLGVMIAALFGTDLMDWYWGLVGF
jgi:leader peptidase (prepilin peptidase) / N-methyltransferase